MPSALPQCFGSQHCSRGWPLPWCSPSSRPCSCHPEQRVLPPEHHWVGEGLVCLCLQRFPNRKLPGQTRRKQPAVVISHLKNVEHLPCGGVVLGSCPRSQRRSWTCLGCHPACIQSDHWHMLCTRLSWSRHWLPVAKKTRVGLHGARLTPRQMKAKLDAYLLEPHWALNVCPPGDRWTARAASQNCSTSVLYLKENIVKNSYPWSTNFDFPVSS